MCVRCWAVYIILTVSRQLHKSHNSIHNARPDNSGCELLLFFFSFSYGRPIGLHAQSSGLGTCHDRNSIAANNKIALYVHISVYKKSPSGLRPEGRISAVPPSFTSEHIYAYKLECLLSCNVDESEELMPLAAFWVLQLKSYLP